MIALDNLATCRTWLGHAADDESSSHSLAPDVCPRAVEILTALRDVFDSLEPSDLFDTSSTSDRWVAAAVN